MKKHNIKILPSTSKKKESLLTMMKEDNLTTKFTMNMPVNLHRDFKKLAAEQRISMGDIVISILNKYIQENA